MTKPRSPIANLSLAVGVIASAVIGVPVSANRERLYEPMRELRAITAIRVEVDGMPNPLDGTDISEKTLASDVKESLLALGVPLAKELDFQAPRLHITVLAQRVAAAYSFTILVQLEERCSVARNPKLSIPWCVTWSSYPTIGSMEVAQAAGMKDKVLQAVARFGMAYIGDNK